MEDKFNSSRTSKDASSAFEKVQTVPLVFGHSGLRLSSTDSRLKTASIGRTLETISEKKCETKSRTRAHLRRLRSVLVAAAVLLVASSSSFSTSSSFSASASLLSRRRRLHHFSDDSVPAIQIPSFNPGTVFVASERCQKKLRLTAVTSSRKSRL